MGSTFGTCCKISIFGESHGNAIGVTIDGFPAGINFDEEFIKSEMARRAPSSNVFSTSRKEADEFEVLSGVFDGRTTGAPITAIIRNTNQHSSDYEGLRTNPRPSHADFTAFIRYNNNHDVRGGGHFSGRLTAPLVFAGALCKLALEQYEIHIISHISSVGDIKDTPFDKVNITPETIDLLSEKAFPVMDETASELMTALISKARISADSVGGTIECAVLGLPAGLGSPMFDGVESVLSQIIFGIPAVKGLEFGSGFSMSAMFGSQANDEFCINEDGDIATRSNNNGGILGGITSGMPVIFKTAIKPTASIGRPQKTVNLRTGTETDITVGGRHDPCIVPRAVPVIEAAAAVAFLDMMLLKNGYNKE
ncbi:MAG: chorismate synthase [Clostridia bacterium]|nr:chorismate synthase [Clostridia bacterium]